MRVNARRGKRKGDHRRDGGKEERGKRGEREVERRDGG